MYKRQVYDQDRDTLSVHKAKGRLKVLADQLQNGAAVKGTVGIGHTRWATHGAPSDVNSHPQVSQSGKIAVVHNGIDVYKRQHQHPVVDPSG